MLKRIIPLIGLVGMLAMVLAACGGDDEDTAAPAASTTSTTTTTAAADPTPTSPAPMGDPIDINFLSSWPVTLDSAAYFFTEIFPALIY